MDFWKDYARRNGYAPSYREVALGVGLKSVSSIAYQVRQLEELGYLSREPGRARAALLAPEDVGRWNVPVPIVGRIAAGKPIFADEDVEEVISLPEQLVGKGDLIMLRVAGDSMINAAIADGDLVVVRRETDVHTGDIVAAMLPSDISSDGEATVKTLKLVDGHVWLMPQNPDYAPILGDKAKIIGKVVTVMRRL